MRLNNDSEQPIRSPTTAFAVAVDIGLAVLIALILLRAMFFFEHMLVLNITASLTGAVPFETATGIAVIDASITTRVVDIVLSLVTAIGFMYLAQMYKRPYGTTIALLMAACGWAWYFWEVGGIPGVLKSEYGFLQQKELQLLRSKITGR